MSLGEFKFAGFFDPSRTPAEENAVRRSVADYLDRIEHGTDAGKNAAIATQIEIYNERAALLFDYYGLEFPVPARHYNDDAYWPPYPVPNSVLVELFGPEAAFEPVGP